MFFTKNFKTLSKIYHLAQQAFGEYKIQILILTILGFLNGLLGGIGINAVIPLFSLVMGEESENIDFISKYIKNFLESCQINFSLQNILILIVLIFIIKTIIVIAFSYINVRITSGYQEKTRNKLFAKMLGAKWSYLIKQKLGHLEVILTINVENSKNFLAQIGIFIRSITSLIAYTFIAVNISFNITLMTFVFGVLLFFVFKPLIRKVRNISFRSEKINRDLSHHVNENIIGLKTVKALNVDGQVLEKSGEYFAEMRRINIRSYILNIFSSSLIEPLSMILVAGVFAVSYKFFDFNFAALIAIIYLIKQIFLYITDLQQQVISMNSTIPYLKSVLDYESEAVSNKESDLGKRDFIFNNELNFNQVSFQYESSERDVLNNISFKVKKGEMVGIIGPSGAGKTTVVDLILRLFDPLQGKILLDNRDIKEIKLSAWRQKIAYVSQDMFLMNDTIKNNIKFYQTDLSDVQIEKVCRMAQIYDFIEQCPQGLETIIGERGVLLSGGQRQRIIIARILARNPEILVLDEATSALDNESELKIQNIITGLKRKITVIVIAHRLSTVLNSDRLIVIENGKIIEQDSPDNLLADKQSYFSKVYNLRD